MQTIALWAKANGHAPNSPEAVARLGHAYTLVFTANATREDAEIVLVDLAVSSRFYEAMLATTPADVLKSIDGRRLMFRRLIGFLADATVLGELQIAALSEVYLTLTKDNVE